MTAAIAGLAHCSSPRSKTKGLGLRDLSLHPFSHRTRLGKRHAAEGREVHVHAVIDTFTSAPWFDGFREHITARGLDDIDRPTTDARSWMLTTGWRRHGLLSVHDLPATADTNGVATAFSPTPWESNSCPPPARHPQRSSTFL